MMKLTLDEQAWLDEYRKALDGGFPGIVEEILIFGSKARGDSGVVSDLDVLVVLREADRQAKREVRHTGHLLSALSDAQPSIMVYTKREWQERERRLLAFLPGSNARRRARGMRKNPVIAEWRRATESMGAAMLCQREGYYADSVSRAYYAIMHAARAALLLHNVTARSHAGVRSMFGLHIVRTGLVEPEWAAAVGDSADERITSDYDAATIFDEADALVACGRANAFLGRIQTLLTCSIASEELDVHNR